VVNVKFNFYLLSLTRFTDVDALIEAKLSLCYVWNNVAAVYTVILIFLLHTATRAHVTYLIKVTILTAITVIATAVNRNNPSLLPFIILFWIKDSDFTEKILRTYLLLR
jgi:hypothetical protein